MQRPNLFLWKTNQEIGQLSRVQTLFPLIPKKKKKRKKKIDLYHYDL